MMIKLARAFSSAPSRGNRMTRMTRTRLAIASLAFGVAVLAGGSDASAQQKGGGVITINEVTIVGRVQKPVASVDVSKIQPKLTLAELRQPFLDRIEEAARKDPF
jgi:hypothetical protein